GWPSASAMNSATVSGPWARMRRARRSASGVTGAVCAVSRCGASGIATGDRAGVRRPARSARLRHRLRAQQQGEADEDQRHRQDLAHGDAVGEEAVVAEKDVGLAEELGDDARAAVADEEDPGE